MGNKELFMTAVERAWDEHMAAGGSVDAPPSSTLPPELIALGASEVVDQMLLFSRFVFERTNYWRPLSVGRLYRLAYLCWVNMYKRDVLEGVIDDDTYIEFRNDLRARAVHWGENMNTGINPDALPPPGAGVPGISMPGGG